jgi:hypothetical protein
MPVFAKNPIQIKLACLLLVPVLFIMNCSSQTLLNDFFGIEMPLDEQAGFQIKSYSAKNGASYTSTPDMDIRIFAWAEMGRDVIHLQVINSSNKQIPLSYNTDKFILETTDHQKFILNKGKSLEYAPKKRIGPGGKMDFKLELPSKFWDSVGMRNVQSENENYSYDFWTGLNKFDFLKENVALLVVELGDSTTIVLKPVPKSPEQTSRTK